MSSQTLKHYLKLLISVATLSPSLSFSTVSYSWTSPSFSSSSKKPLILLRVWDHDGKVGIIHCSLCRRNFLLSLDYQLFTHFYIPTIHLFHLFNTLLHLYISSHLGWEATVSQRRNLRELATSWKLIQQMFLLCCKLAQPKRFYTY